MNRRNRSASTKSYVIQFAKESISVIASVLTIVLALQGVWSWFQLIEFSVEMHRTVQVLPLVTARPTTRPVPTFTNTPTPEATVTSTPMPVLVGTSTPTVLPEQVHRVQPSEILACIAKFYYDYADAHAELCKYNQSHPASALYAKADCSTIFPGDEIIIPGTLRAFVVTDVKRRSLEEKLLTALVARPPDNGYLCQIVDPQ